MAQPNGYSNLSIRAAVSSGSCILSTSGRGHHPSLHRFLGQECLSELYSELSAAVNATFCRDLCPQGAASAAACHPGLVSCCPAAAASPKQRMPMQAAPVLPTPQHKSETCKAEDV